jgi:hypothetical protein
VHQHRQVAFDFILSASVPFLALWIYEISNFAVLAAQGSSVSLSMNGLLPLGVAGVSSVGLSPLTKILQVALAIAFILPLGAAFSKQRLFISMASVLSSVGIYLASAYWEMLSLLSTIPMSVHVGVFIAGTSAIAVILLRSLSRPLQFQYRLAPVRTPRIGFESSSDF